MLKDHKNGMQCSGRQDIVCPETAKLFIRKILSISTSYDFFNVIYSYRYYFADKKLNFEEKFFGKMDYKTIALY